jgi:hypothetical protein
MYVCICMYIYIHVCMYIYVYIYTYIYICIHIDPNRGPWAVIHRYVPIYTDMYRYTPICTDIHRYVPVCIHIDPNAVGTDRERKMLQPVSDSYYASLADSCCTSQVYTDMYRYTPICTDINRYVPIYSNVYSLPCSGLFSVLLTCC